MQRERLFAVAVQFARGADVDDFSNPGAEYRCIGYYSLSELLTLEFLITKNGQVNSTVQIKCMSPKHQPAKVVDRET